VTRSSDAILSIHIMRGSRRTSVPRSTISVHTTLKKETLQGRRLSWNREVFVLSSCVSDPFQPQVKIGFTPKRSLFSGEVEPLRSSMTSFNDRRRKPSCIRKGETELLPHYKAQAESESPTRPWVQLTCNIDCVLVQSSQW
jgi:hypothetical protein